ncbi:MAG: glycosyltransferase family 39 protein [Candidatus Krumholzibacteriota bacterium]|nr:glycosyltransferase family 39 protein [Candidatus Krumholzibacteriota bacterium]
MMLDRIRDSGDRSVEDGASRRGPGDERVFVVSVLLLALALRLFHLGHQSLWIDEILTIIVATPKPDHPIGTLLLHNIHGPLHTFVVYLFRFAGENDYWLRVPSALAGVASVWFLYAWVREILGRRYAQIASVLLAVNPLHIHYSQEVRNYAFVFLFVLMASLYLERLARRWTARRAVGYAVCVAAAALSNFSAAFVFAVHTVIWFKRRRLTRVSVARWITVSVLIAVLIAPWVYRVYTFIDVSDLVTPVRPGAIETDERLRGETTFSMAALPYTFYSFSVGFTLGPGLSELHDNATVVETLRNYRITIGWVALLFGSLATLGAVRLWRREPVWFELLLYLLVPLLATFALSWQNAKAFNVRYVLLALPAWLVLLSAGVRALPFRMRWLSGAAVAATTIASLWNYEFVGRYAKEDVRGAVRYIEEQPEAYDCIFAPTVWQIVEHYAQAGAPVEQLFRRTWLPMDRVDAQLDELFAACNTFWYIRARPWVDDPDGYALDMVRDRYREMEVEEFNGVTIFLFEARNDVEKGR